MTTFYPDFWSNLVNDYICHSNHNDRIRSFSYKRYTSFYVIWIHYNADDYFDIVQELKVILDLRKEYNLFANGCSKATIRKYKCSCDDQFENIAMILFRRM